MSLENKTNEKKDPFFKRVNRWLNDDITKIALAVTTAYIVMIGLTYFASRPYVSESNAAYNQMRNSQTSVITSTQPNNITPNSTANITPTSNSNIYRGRSK